VSSTSYDDAVSTKSISEERKKPTKSPIPEKKRATRVSRQATSDYKKPASSERKRKRVVIKDSDEDSSEGGIDDPISFEEAADYCPKGQRLQTMSHRLHRARYPAPPWKLRP